MPGSVPDDRTSLADRKLDLLAELMAEAGLDAAVPRAAVQRARPEALPLSYPQQLLWQLDRSAPGMSAYNVPIVRRATGALDADAFRSALTALVARHEILRTTYAGEGDSATQVVHPPRPVLLDVVDLRSSPAGERDDAAARLVAERVRMPFDLTHDLLLRGMVIRLADADSIVIVESHHIVLDGWSRGLLVRELGALYRALHRGEQPALPPVTLQYADHAVAEQDALKGERLDTLLTYWRKQLAGVPELLELPTDRPRPAAPSFEGGQAETVLPRPLLDGLVRLARENDATLYMALLAAYQALLHRYSGQTDIVIGSPSAGRTRAETTGLMGYLANMLVLRGDLSGDPTYVELLRRTRETTLAAYEHQEVPFEKLVLELVGTQQRGDAPLVQAVLTMADSGTGALELDGLTLAPLAYRRGSVKFDLTMLASERPEGLRLVIEYRKDLFDGATIERLLSHLRLLVEALVSAPDTRVSGVPLMTTAERTLLLGQWSQGEPTAPAGETLLARVEHWAARDGGRAAVTAGGRTLTFGELDRAATGLARRLQANGVMPGDVVGLCTDRSPDAIVAIIAAWKVGAAYTPILAELPPARIAQLVTQAGVRVAMTSAVTAAAVPAGVHAVPVAPLSQADPQTGPSLPAARLDQAAYVLFTSGSTGMPKGVAVTHANVIHYTTSIASVLGLDLDAEAGWQFAAVSTLAADLGNTSVLPALASGGTLHLLDTAVTTDGRRFVEYLAAHPIDVLKITPGHFRALVQDGPLSGGLPRRWLVLGGEACPRDLAEAVIRTGTCRVLNHYGPTETTVGACTFPATAASTDAAATLPIGRPLPGTRVYVLDANRQPAPVGVPGELWIGGRGVAAGYIGRPDLTAERFLADPFSAPGERIYRTGDRVRWLADGNLEFLGRTDDQVKIRGYRVELREIEATLLAHPAVRDAAVILRSDTSDAALAAYVTLSADGSAGTTDLTAYLAARLPDYMVPETIMSLAALPRSANGKIDRRALPAPAHAASAGFIAPRTPLEAAVAAIWAEALKRERVGVTDNFLELGGHSLLAIRVLGKLARQFGVRLSLRALFEAPTVEQIAAAVAAAGGAVGATAPPSAPGIARLSRPSSPGRTSGALRTVPDASRPVDP